MVGATRDAAADAACIANEDDRIFAVLEVLEVRAMEAERSPVRTRPSHEVTLNKDATCLQNLIVWDTMKTNEHC